MWGCEKPVERPLYDHPVFGKLHRCPRRLVTPETWRVADAYNDYVNGFLPAAGGAGDQDYRLMRGIKIIAETVADIQEQRRENRERELKRGR